MNLTRLKYITAMKKELANKCNGEIFQTITIVIPFFLSCLMWGSMSEDWRQHTVTLYENLRSTIFQLQLVRRAKRTFFENIIFSFEKNCSSSSYRSSHTLSHTILWARIYFHSLRICDIRWKSPVALSICSRQNEISSREPKTVCIYLSV